MTKDSGMISYFIQRIYNHRMLTAMFSKSNNNMNVDYDSNSHRVAINPGITFQKFYVLLVL